MAYGQQISASHAALMPTLSLSYLQLPNHRNLWKEPAAAILDRKGLHLPSDPETGEATAKHALDDSRHLTSKDDLQFYGQSTAPSRQHIQSISRARVPLHLAHDAGHLHAHGTGIAGSLRPYSARSLGRSHQQLFGSVGMEGTGPSGSGTSGGLADSYRADPTTDITNSRKIRSVILRRSDCRPETLLKVFRMTNDCLDQITKVRQVIRKATVSTLANSIH